MESYQTRKGYFTILMLLIIAVVSVSIMICIEISSRMSANRLLQNSSSAALEAAAYSYLEYPFANNCSQENLDCISLSEDSGTIMSERLLSKTNPNYILNEIQYPDFDPNGENIFTVSATTEYIPKIRLKSSPIVISKTARLSIELSASDKYNQHISKFK